MNLITKILGQWRPVVAMPIRTAQGKKPVQNGYVKTGGIWRPFFQAFKALRVTGRAISGVTQDPNLFHYESISFKSITIANGDKLVYEMYPMGPVCSTGIDAMCYNPDGSIYAALRDYGHTGHPNAEIRNTTQLADQEGRPLHSGALIENPPPLNHWYYRVIDLSQVAGKTIKDWAVVFEGDQGGDYTTYFRYIRIEDSNGVVKGELFRDTLEVSALTVFQGTSHSYSNITKTVVAAPL